VFCFCVVNTAHRFSRLTCLVLTIFETADVNWYPGGFWSHKNAKILQCICRSTASLFSSYFYVCRREELYADADKFKPERFFHSESDNSYRFVPFLYGPRQCLGYRFAIAEMRALLATLLRQFQFDLDPSGPAAYKRHLGVTMRPDPPLTLKVSLVSPHWPTFSVAELEFITSVLPAIFGVIHNAQRRPPSCYNCALTFNLE